MLRKKDQGFTLIELMIVVLIVAILVAIAIPTFLGQRKEAEDSAAKSNLRNALATEKAYYAGGAGAFTDDLDTLSSIEPSLFNVTGASPAVNTFDPVVVTVDGAAATVCIVAATPRGEYLAIWEVTSLTILALTSSKSMRLMPGLRGRPAVMTTTSLPSVAA